MNERIKMLRESQSLSRAAFGERLGVSGDVINNLERGRVEPKDHIIKLICAEYSVNEVWLRTGTGEMYAKPTTFSLNDFVKSKGGSDLELEIMRAYFELDPEIRRAVLDHFKKHLMPDQPKTAHIEEEVAAYRADLELEERQGSSASDMPSEKEA